ncbi:unnamed protein product [Cyprideis torosa]|uniref:Phenylacetate-CoA oxygenase subunit PaaJ n=1 Tax=Cyprideis torosa TaxID=163714 RepID=A0A7R8WP25_9CRUS|nr:unnamed protein product [Cyprideis torosa]CAG0906892.1 unnamed protein product [Cyprideis torosa]
MVSSRPTVETIWRWLGDVPDPEIPVISVTDLGIVRDVRWEDDHLIVAVTPTYSGCPATAVIDMEIESHLRKMGVENLRLERRLSPPWTTDWVTPEGKEKLRAFGIAPPIEGTAPDGRLNARASRLTGARGVTVACPRCGANDTREQSRFGSTPCKAAYVCNACMEPFDYFKCI